MTSLLGGRAVTSGENWMKSISGGGGGGAGGLVAVSVFLVADDALSSRQNASSSMSVLSLQTTNAHNSWYLSGREYEVHWRNSLSPFLN